MEPRNTSKIESDYLEAKRSSLGNVDDSFAKNYLHSRANRIQKLSDQIFEAIEMPERLRVKPKVEELPPPPPEKPDNLKKHLEIRRRSSNISIMTMPELHRRVSLDVGDFLEGRRFSLESGLSGRLSLLTNKSSKKQLPKEISPLQMNVLAYPEWVIKRWFLAIFIVQNTVVCYSKLTYRGNIPLLLLNFSKQRRILRNC